MAGAIDQQMSAGNVRNLRKAVATLRLLKSDRNRLNTLLDLQRFLLRRILSRERAVIRIRKVLAKLRSVLRSGRLSKAEATEIKRKIGKCPLRIKHARHWIFIWKCFGVGAACVYQSPYNLKHLYYDQEYNVKQDA